jgi:hypothetical protein
MMKLVAPVMRGAIAMQLVQNAAAKAKLEGGASN